MLIFKNNERFVIRSTQVEKSVQSGNLFPKALCIWKKQAKINHSSNIKLCFLKYIYFFLPNKSFFLEITMVIQTDTV